MSPGAMLLHGESPIILSDCTIHMTNHPHSASLPFMIHVYLPKTPQCLGIRISYDSYHNVPYLINCDFDSCFYKVLQQSQAMSLINYWLVSIDAEEPISLQSTLHLL